MSTITIVQECGCFKRSDLENNTSFENNDEAMIKAQEMLNHMNTKFCGKHGFELSENGQDFSIAMKAPQAASGGCCGGGHCS
ncbi:MAG TPA: hypothetical protein PLH07_04795 [Sulfurovum sp.]|jgi:hypothetical protein|nr:MAG: hypothetical protein B7Y63_09240 [Sulfurovum sp. 35-42-20]OYZ26274.1 MAG: hypothetical protein B7Y23_02280 [Sulfurovum sp. 16-42-52]OYZ47776.1 MAG: hypothetical protein B7Y13_09415 [Sulfurovum sp. 24-42-9]OZA46548.1 MAG: hypothetical protein B7X80_02275 [Sulfurovum sp. 17-42-90]HQS72452.1 hypothetical protein [Sulfurovum sp.]